MKKSEIYVPITSEKERLEAIDILEKAGEEILSSSDIFNKFMKGKLCYYIKWSLPSMNYQTDKTKITLSELKKLLQPKTADKLIEKFKKKMAKKGFKVDVVFDGIE